VTVEKDEPLKLELEAFVDCGTHSFRPKVSGSEAAEALKVAIEITRMIEAAGVEKRPRRNACFSSLARREEIRTARK
jgi:hypothetical protein